MRLQRIWLILIAAIATCVVLLVCLVFVTEEDETTKRPAHDLQRRLERLRSVPYTALTEEKVDTSLTAVTIHKPPRTYQGYNIYCSKISSEAFLMDMAGNIVHKWSYPQEKPSKWSHASMLPNGDLIVLNLYRNVLRLDWNSNLVWKKDHLAVHHDIAFLEDHTFYVIAREVIRYRGLHVRFPQIVHLTPDGEEIGIWSARDHMSDIMQAFDTRSFLDTVLDSMIAAGDSLGTVQPSKDRVVATGVTGRRGISPAFRIYDYFHLNTISLLPNTPLANIDSRFKPGNLLTCFRNVNQIAILDRDSMEILWVWGEGTLEWPHHPTMLENGNILIFDNGVRRKYSTVVELNPVTESIEWEYVGDPPESFYTYQKGSAQRFPNGNTLICEGDLGRAFEVTRDGEIVWEWLNPTIKKGRREQVYRMMRLPAETVEPLLTDRQSRRCTDETIELGSAHHQIIHRSMP